MNSVRRWWLLTLDAWVQRLAWRLPHGLVTWCFVRVVSHATTGRYSATVLPEILAMTALERWNRDHSREVRHGS